MEQDGARNTVISTEGQVMTSDESELGWLRIAVELGSVKFRRGGVANSLPTPEGRKPGKFKSMHQNSCGHGYRPPQQHPWNGLHHQDRQDSDHRDTRNSTSLMGASPSECLRRWKDKDRFKTFSNK